MPPRARSTQLPEFLSNATLGEMLAAELEELAAPEPPAQHDSPEAGSPARRSPRDRARRSMLNRAATEVRAYHKSDSDQQEGNQS